MAEVTWFPVTSSNVAEIGYDDEEQTLWVQFNNGAVYAYYSVPPDVWSAFLESESKGKFIHSDLKGRYPYERVR